MTTLILADDHHLVRKSFRLLLEAEAGFKVIAETSDGVETIELVKKKQPTVLLLDLAIPRVHGLDVIRQVTEQTQTKVLIVSMHTAEAYVEEALANGASGYVLKSAMPAELINAIREVVLGRKYLSSDMKLRDIMPGIKARDRRKNLDPLSALTRREKVILQLAAEGNNNTQIAKQLSLSPRTVESHRASLMRKLSLRSQTEIVRFAVRKNIISI